eukprot:TRINITY_DN75399_c0_g1_i1.p1 TRINITY_DN75399_c0_g1~~TRINITY_DN75399_c0_g1_i1.p1  ORF type:complete len:324 (-),score=61.07 TRINITY_DN75399_c0_g1_i1:114-1085(-)
MTSAVADAAADASPAEAGSTSSSFSSCAVEVPLLAAFNAAAHSGRATTLCKPRPADTSPSDVRSGLAAMSAGKRCGAQLTGADASLQGWLMSVQEQRLLRQGAEFDAALASYHAHSCEIEAACGRPDYILPIAPPRLAGFQARAAGVSTRWAFHGSAFENVWSILNTGLVNAAQIDPNLARTGSLFGKGIYLSIVPSYAFNFAKTSPPLANGHGRWSCLFLCEVAPGPLVSVGGVGAAADDAHSAATVPRADKDAFDVPEGVIIVEDSEAVVVRCALFFYRGSSSGEEGECSRWVQLAAAAAIVGIAFLPGLLKATFSQQRSW